MQRLAFRHRFRLGQAGLLLVLLSVGALIAGLEAALAGLLAGMLLLGGARYSAGGAPSGEGDTGASGTAFYE